MATLPEAPPEAEAPDSSAPDTAVTAPEPDAPDERRASRTFQVRLHNFEGPFDLLLSLIAKHKMDVTEVALAVVTDEFVAHIREAERASREAAERGEVHESWDLGVASEFLVIAATLLDLKAARLLPGVIDEDTEDLELLEARDLLFARLLQYRAYKEISKFVAERLAAGGRRVPRLAPLEPHLAELLPELVWDTPPERLADLAAKVLAPKPPPVVGLSHLHGSAVSVRDEAGVLVRRLRTERSVTFRSLTSGTERLVTVARFLALLELFRDALVAFEQVTPLGELTVRWTAGPEDGERYLGPGAGPSEFDEESGPVAADGVAPDPGGIGHDGTGHDGTGQDVTEQAGTEAST
ncbi:segregation and condensation protein A [Promicromonospora citrea]|uniref:Segregation and condensation protein A n=1 Tax=Promicromonospora citrea TaxID=43677 RepID=A0A8H9L7H6_9MICO|nr:segregation/condensation protein A [Promicromonospora citrea]GGM40478.1 segregation/condensation protein A [Promicromonospora citrea]